MEGLAADLDECVEAFEAAWAAGPPSIARFLPPGDRPDYLAVLTELVRIDLEFRADRGEFPCLDRYRAAFPALFADPARAREVAFEAERLRAAGMSKTATVESAPGTTSRFPEPGEVVLDFQLVRELGRGAFGRVYLAEQGGLAGRPVAVKITTRPNAAEPDTLARLQHTHIVPVHSVHQSGGLHLLVMPYLGGTTLADVLTALRGRSAWPATGRELADTLSNRLSTTVGMSADAPAAGPPKPGVAVEGLARFTYPEAVLWVGARLAEALAHAHDRGILHRDVKPANVLLADDGRPMLLDFNLAGRTEAATGGTPAYMAPEQLRGLRGGREPIGPAADLYAVGLVLFELLTGRPPFPLPPKSAADPVKALLDGRETPPRLRPLAPSVSPSVEAIVRRCLEPDPARRYPSAEALADDLNRQLADRPLLHTREPSARERVRKWRRRNPRLTVAALVAAAVGLLAGGVAWQRLERVRAAGVEYAALRERIPAARAALSLHPEDDHRRADAMVTLHALEGFRSAERLTATDQAERSAATAELLRLAAVNEADPAAAVALLDQAEQFGPLPRALALKRAALGGPTRLPPPDGRDDYYEGLNRLHAGDPAGAVEKLRSAADAGPDDPWQWLALGVAYSRLGRLADAEACHQTAIALMPGQPIGYYNRGLARLQQSKLVDAETDFAAALRLQPDHLDALAGRGQARLSLGNPAGAAADLTAALDAGAAETRLYLLRAEARAKLGDAAGAAADRAKGLAAVPEDEASWVQRGLAKLAADPAGAVADFDAALRLNPRSYSALRGKSQALDEGLHRPADSLAVVDRLLELYPHDTAVRAGRAVLLARGGHRDAAHADAGRCLAANPTDFERYQLAGVYAQTSRTHAADAALCFRLLAAALHRGTGFEFVEDPKADPDLDPVRGRPEFRLIVDAAKLARSAAKD
jgi:serine/threonine protein kinase/Flp pilus assembly protein TadD